MVIESFHRYFKKSAKYFEEYKQLLEKFIEFPTVANRDHQSIINCTDWLRNQFEKYGYTVKLYNIGEKISPVIYAEKQMNAEKTLMFYHHYDIQPETPLELWQSSPWKLTEKNNRFYGRGTSDDKGELLISLIGLQLLEEENGQLPINVKFILDGEEEAGSQNLPKFIDKHSELIRGDCCIWEGATITPHDENNFLLDTPLEILCGLKGNVDFNISTIGPPFFPRTDVHSAHAASSPNAAWRLVWALSTLKDQRENILIDGFNELVEVPSDKEIEELDKIGSSYESKFKEDFQIKDMVLQRTGLDLLVELILKPSLTICGMHSGQDKGEAKTIIPSSAFAKLDFRLVPNLTVEKTELLLKDHFIKNGFTDIHIERTSGYNPAKTPITHPIINLLRKTIQTIVNPNSVVLYPFAIGSGPAYLFNDHIPLCIIQNYVDQLNVHAPNENIPIRTIKPSLALTASIANALSNHSIQNDEQHSR